MVFRNLKKILAGFVVLLLSLVLSWLLKQGDLLIKSQQSLSNALYGGRSVSEDIIIVAIDDQTLLPVQNGGLGLMKNWTRETYAQVIDNIGKEEPSVLLLDILFSSTSNGLSGQEIYQIASDYPKYSDFVDEILLYIQTPHPHDQVLEETFSRYDNVYLIKTASGEADFNGTSFEYPSELIPFQPFAEVTKQGFANTVTSEDTTNLNTIYSIPAFFSINGRLEEHLDLKLAREHLGEETVLEIPTEQGQMLINYAQPSYSYPMVSFSDVYSGNVEAGVFEDKIVLVGATASILQDRHFTPIDQRVPMPGVEIHANAIQTILDGEYLNYQSTGSFLLVTGLMLLVGVLGFLYLPIWAGGLLLVLELAVFPLYARWSFAHGVIPDLIWPVFALVVAYFATMAYRNFTEFREKRKLKTAFSHYVSAELVEEISQNPDQLKLGGERREITTLFLDIENFTSLSEKLEPQEVVAIINRYFDALAGVIMKHQGTVDKFEGDAIMALFGAPVMNETHALNACRAALELRDTVQQLNAETGHNLNIRVGIATGEAIVGNMGSANRFDYTAMGDTVNTASRLESGNKFYGTRLLCTAASMEAAQEALVFRRIDRVRLKGKEEAVDIYEIMGRKEDVSQAGIALIGKWHQALEYYRNQNWDEAVLRIQNLQESLPEDGPAATYLKRIEALRMNPMQGWDGTWSFDRK